MEAVGLKSPSTAQMHLETLVAEGQLVRKQISRKREVYSLP
jgi:hypothetical protein